ncbi:MAG: class I SAM-dependent methyltransferase [Burkholderiaceae bacterium]|nr:class I SAM-dependent methyltransferase [Burkholderiaceae bacterium]
MNRVCPLTERATATDVIEGLAPAPWVVRRCRETGFVFLENPPGYESLKEDLAWQVTYQRESQQRASAEPIRYTLSRWAKHLRRKVAKRHKVADMTLALATRAAAERGAAPVHLVDVGCGWGELLGLVMERMPPALRQRCVPHGVELSTELARLSNRALAPYGGHCEHASAVDGMAGFAPGSLDVIVLSSFLEHEIAPLPLLRHCRDALREGGGVLIKVPNHASWNRSLRGARWCGYRWPDHINYFTPDTLRAMARKAGLEVERLSWRDRFPLSDSLYAVLRRATVR